MKLSLKHLLMAIIGLLFTFPSAAKESLSEKANSSYYNHLVEVNAEWKKYAAFAPTQITTFNTDADRIQSHLKLVIAYLTEHGNSNLNSNQETNRIHLLNELATYADKKIFPINSAYGHRQPCFVDEKETHCAVGYMMAVSGHHDLVENIRTEHNYAYLQDIKTTGVTEWANEFGFTLAELKWIQPGYPPGEQYDALGEGTNGTVWHIERKYSTSSAFLFAGDFSAVDGMDCLNVGIYQDNTLSCLGTGIAGTVEGIYNNADYYYVYGELEQDGMTYPIAKFDGSDWTYISIPEREGAIASAGSYVYTYQGILSISHPDVAGQEVWYLTDEDEWQLKAQIDGKIHAIDVSPVGHVFAGNFSSTATLNEEGDVDINTAKNVMIRSLSSDNWTILNQPISDTVKCIYELSGALYFGGSANEATEGDICLSRYYLGTVSPLRKLSNFWGNDFVSINAIGYYKSYFILGGDFQLFADGVGTFGNNLCRYSLVSNLHEATAQFDKPVHCILSTYSNLYIGGDFSTAPSGSPYHHLVKLRITSGLIENDAGSVLEVYPNPFINTLQIKGITNATSYTIFNQLGQVVKQGQIENQSIQQLDDLPKGSYLLVLKNKTKEWQFKILK